MAETRSGLLIFTMMLRRRARIRRCLAAGLLLGLSTLFLPLTQATTKKPPPRPININSANSTELQEVPGIGPATADKILQMRKSYGAFKSVDDLLAIRGIGKKRLDKMRKYLVAGQVPAPAKPVAAKSAIRSHPAAKDPPMPDKTAASAKSPVKPAAADKPPAASEDADADSDEEPQR
jgi:competence ComEA-like helix-hairpin-helix protein